MRMLISVLAMLLAMVSWASAGCWSDMLDTHLTAYWNNRWGEMATDCDEELMEEWLGVMCGMWDISHDITYVDCHTDWPLKTTNDWYDDYPRSRLFWVSTS